MFFNSSFVLNESCFIRQIFLLLGIWFMSYFFPHCSEQNTVVVFCMEIYMLFLIFLQATFLEEGISFAFLGFDTYVTYMPDISASRLGNQSPSLLFIFEFFFQSVF